MSVPKCTFPLIFGILCEAVDFCATSFSVRLWCRDSDRSTPLAAALACTTPVPAAAAHVHRTFHSIETHAVQVVRGWDAACHKCVLAREAPRNPSMSTKSERSRSEFNWQEDCKTWLRVGHALNRLVPDSRLSLPRLFKLLRDLEPRLDTESWTPPASRSPPLPEKPLQALPLCALGSRSAMLAGYSSDPWPSFVMLQRPCGP